MMFVDDWLLFMVGLLPLKNMKVKWDDDISNIWKVKKNVFQTTNQMIMNGSPSDG